MRTRFLLLWLEAPLQSWGSDSKFGRRDTLNFPTKSGITGLLLCALGISGEQKELLAQMAPLKQTIISFTHVSKDSEGRLQKKDREPLLRDFHMVGSGYDETNPWENLMIPKKRDGKSPVGAGTKMTYRYYLQDAKFAVVIEVPMELSVQFAKALQNPVYNLFLGRKNCIPSDFICRGTFNSEEDTLQKAEEIALDKGLKKDFSVVDGEFSDKGIVMTVNDIPIQFGESKRYRDRRVTVIQYE